MNETKIIKVLQPFLFSCRGLKPYIYIKKPNFQKIGLQIKTINQNCYLSSIQKHIIGMLCAFKKYIRVKGVGYRFVIYTTNILEIVIGYTHRI